MLDLQPDSTQKEATLRILLALVDSSSNVRAGRLSTAQICIRVPGVTEPTVKDTLEFLAGSNVRLVRKHEHEDPIVYELAHERLIFALRRLANENLTDDTKAQLLFDRRVNEWLANDRSSRYLLTRKELQQITNHRSMLNFEMQQEQKTDFLTVSGKRIQRIRMSIGALLTLAMAFFFLWNTAWWQLELTKRDLHQFAATSNGAESLGRADGRLAAGGLYEEAVPLFNKALAIAEKISKPEDQASALSSIADGLGKLPADKQDARLLDRAMKAAEKTSDPYYQLRIFSSIEDELGKLPPSSLLLETGHARVKNSDNVNVFFIGVYILGVCGDIRNARSVLSRLHDDNDKLVAIAFILEGNARRNRQHH